MGADLQDSRRRRGGNIGMAVRVPTRRRQLPSRPACRHVAHAIVREQLGGEGNQAPPRTHCLGGRVQKGRQVPEIDQNIRRENDVSARPRPPRRTRVLPRPRVLTLGPRSERGNEFGHSQLIIHTALAGERDHILGQVDAAEAPRQVPKQWAAQACPAAPIENAPLAAASTLSPGVLCGQAGEQDVDGLAQELRRLVAEGLEALVKGQRVSVEHVSHKLARGHVGAAAWHVRVGESVLAHPVLWTPAQSAGFLGGMWSVGG